MLRLFRDFNFRLQLKEQNWLQIEKAATTEYRVHIITRMQRHLYSKGTSVPKQRVGKCSENVISRRGLGDGRTDRIEGASRQNGDLFPWLFNPGLRKETGKSQHLVVKHNSEYGLVEGCLNVVYGKITG